MEASHSYMHETIVEAVHNGAVYYRNVQIQISLKPI